MNMEIPARLKLDDLPEGPGVYLFRDRDGRLIYVGKAKSLRSRVRSYFQGSSGGQAPKTDALLSDIDDLEYIVTGTEVEALILENNLIKKERPRYNIRLRDDKNFPYLKLTSEERFPRVVLVRRARLDRNAYFGPYLPASAARRTIQMAARHFKVATCYLENMDGTRPRPCLLYQLNQCLGPCAGLVSDADYAQAVHDARLFLEGRTQDLVAALKEKMARASSAEHFESAAHYRDLIRMLSRKESRQAIASLGLEEQDYIAFAREGEVASVQIFQMREGQVRGRRELSFEAIREPDPEFLASCLFRYYESAGDLPATLNVPIEPGGGSAGPSSRWWRGTRDSRSRRCSGPRIPMASRSSRRCRRPSGSTSRRTGSSASTSPTSRGAIRSPRSWSGKGGGRGAPITGDSG